MIGMMVSIQNMRQPPLPTFQLIDYLAGIRRIDRRSDTRIRVMQQKTVVIAETGKLCDLNFGHAKIRLINK
jgi:hypothetical protein